MHNLLGLHDRACQPHSLCGWRTSFSWKTQAQATARAHIGRVSQPPPQRLVSDRRRTSCRSANIDAEAVEAINEVCTACALHQTASCRHVHLPRSPLVLSHTRWKRCSFLSILRIASKWMHKTPQIQLDIRSLMRTAACNLATRLGEVYGVWGGRAAQVSSRMLRVMEAGDERASGQVSAELGDMRAQSLEYGEHDSAAFLRVLQVRQPLRRVGPLQSPFTTTSISRLLRYCVGVWDRDHQAHSRTHAVPGIAMLTATRSKSSIHGNCVTSRASVHLGRSMPSHVIDPYTTT